MTGGLFVQNMPRVLTRNNWSAAVKNILQKTKTETKVVGVGEIHF